MEFAQGTQIQNGNYELLERAGKGGFGTVWKARNRLLEKIVALKFLEHGRTDRVRDMLRQEGRKLARVASFSGRARHIVYINHFFPGDETLPPFLELEWIEGGSLRERLRDPKSLSPQDVLSLAVQLLDGLICAHEVGIIHCDIKPSNILYSGDEGLYKITDFGLSKNLGNLSEDRVAGGTLPYMSPEQFDGGSELTPATDIYSLGCLLYECCERAVPFSGDNNWNEYKRKHRTEKVPPMLNRAVPERLRENILKCLEKEAAARPNGHQLREELSALLGDIQDFRSGQPARHGGLRQLVRLTPRPGEPPVILHKPTGLRFLFPEKGLDVTGRDRGGSLFPERLPTNRDYLLMLREPAFRSWYPSMIAPGAHDGGYLENWFRDQPQSGSENEPLTSLPYQAARDFANWLGARLPHTEDLTLLFSDRDSPLVRSILGLIRRNDLPFLYFWCRDADSGQTEREAVMYRFPDDGPLYPLLSTARRPAHYCFPHYTFLPAIPVGFINDIPVEKSDGEAESEPSHEPPSDVTATYVETRD